MSSIIPQSPLYEVSKDFKESPRVYIKNLSFSTSEEELYQFLKAYEPYTVRFSRSYKHKPFGIAYAEFKTLEEANKVVKELNGAQFKDRPIYVKQHVPFTPKGKPFFGFSKRKPGKADNAKNDQENVNVNENRDKESEAVFNKDGTGTKKLELEPQPQREPQEVEAAENIPGPLTKSDVEPQPEPESEPQENRELSPDTIFLGKVNARTTDQEVREFFQDFNPTQVVIFKGAHQRRRHGAISFRQKRVSALVTLGNSEDLPRAIELSKTKKLHGKFVVVEQAYLNKIKEVTKVAKNSPSVKNMVKSSDTNEAAIEEETSPSKADNGVVELQQEEQGDENVVAAAPEIEDENHQNEDQTGDSNLNNPVETTQHTLSDNGVSLSRIPGMASLKQDQGDDKDLFVKDTIKANSPPGGDVPIKAAPSEAVPTKTPFDDIH